MCCGCQACEQVCPTNCISMIEDKKGFKYPFKNQEKCIECGLCEKVCPFVQKKKIDNNFNGLPKAYYAVNKSADTLMASASGGVFTSVIDTYCKEDFVIFGVQFDDRFKVIHSYSESIEEAKKYRKSKYVQSDINNAYKQAETFLKEEKKFYSQELLVRLPV